MAFLLKRLSSGLLAVELTPSFLVQFMLVPDLFYEMIHKGGGCLNFFLPLLRKTTNSFFYKTPKGRRGYRFVKPFHKLYFTLYKTAFQV